MNDSTTGSSRPVTRSFWLRAIYFVAWFASVAFVASLLLIVNSILTWSVIESLSQDPIPNPGREKIAQAAMLVVPVALLFVQFRVYDFVVDVVSAWRRSTA